MKKIFNSKNKKPKTIKITPADVAIVISLLSIAINTIDFILKKL